VSVFQTILPKRSAAASAHLASLVQLAAMERVLKGPAEDETLPVFAAARQRRADAIARTLGGSR
jgi:hypothetical protein